MLINVETSFCTVHLIQTRHACRGEASGNVFVTKGPIGAQMLLYRAIDSVKIYVLYNALYRIKVNK